MIVGVLFLNLLSLLVIGGDTFTHATASELVQNAPPDYSAKERKALCVRGSCQWVCPDDWCWVAHGHYYTSSLVGGGGYGWAWVSCRTADDCKQDAISDGPSCKHSGGNIFSGDGWGYPYSLNCPWISPEHQAAIDAERQRQADENRRRTIKCFKPEFTPAQVEQAVRDNYHPTVYYSPQSQAPKPSNAKPYRTAECSSNGWCQWSCPDSSCWVASKTTNAAKTSWQWLKCKTADDCKSNGDTRVCRRYDVKVSKDPLEELTLSCPFPEYAGKQEAEEKERDNEVKRWMKCAVPGASPQKIENSLRQMKRLGSRQGLDSYVFNLFGQRIREEYLL